MYGNKHSRSHIMHRQEQSELSPSTGKAAPRKKQRGRSEEKLNDVLEFLEEFPCFSRDYIRSLNIPPCDLELLELFPDSIPDYIRRHWKRALRKQSGVMSVARSARS